MAIHHPVIIIIECKRRWIHQLSCYLWYCFLFEILAQANARCTLCSVLRSSPTSIIINNNNSAGSYGQSQSAVRIRCRVAYDGAGFNGFQFQPGDSRTVQGDLEQVLSRRFNNNDNNNQRLIRIVGAGRTDAGVHARGQAFHFDLEQDDFDQEPSSSSSPELYLGRLQNSMNSMLMKDVRVWNLSCAPPPTKMMMKQPSSSSSSVLGGGEEEEEVLSSHAWHAIYNAERKLYSYRISTSPVMDPLFRHNRWHIEDDKLDMDRLQRILHQYQGTHDFKAFGSDLMDGSVSKKEINTVRTVYSVNLVREQEDGNYRTDVVLQGALYKMVRNMVGTALDVCRGRFSEDSFAQLLEPATNAISSTKKQGRS